MALFGKNKQEQQVIIDIQTQQTWLIPGTTPNAIVRQEINYGIGRIKTTCDIVEPYIKMSDCNRVTETDQTFIIQLKTGKVKVVPKCQVIEIQY